MKSVVFSRGSFKGDVFSIIEKFAKRDFKDILAITRTMFNMPGYK